MSNENKTEQQAVSEVVDGPVADGIADMVDVVVANKDFQVPFHTALQLMIEKGVAMTRASWTDDELVFLSAGSHDFDDSMTTDVSFNGVPVTAPLFARGDHGTTTRLPHFQRVLSSGANQYGWTPSQEDMLAHDWHAYLPQ